MTLPVGEQVSRRVARSHPGAAGVNPVGEEEDERQRGEGLQRYEGRPETFELPHKNACTEMG